MLTLEELESSRQTEFEQRLEALGEDALRGLLADAAALRTLMPQHISDAEGRRIVEAALAQSIANTTAGPQSLPAQSTQRSMLAWLLALFRARRP
jgi:hypothetical protein